jgi:hypothetical protein
MAVNGLCSAIGWSQLGIVATGTNADETNVTGKRIVNPYAFDASGDEDERLHATAYADPSSLSRPASSSRRRRRLHPR